LPFVWNIIFVINGIHRAFGNARFAIDALIGVDVQHRFAFIKTFHGTDDNAVGVTASIAWFGHHMSHLFLLKSDWGFASCGQYVGVESKSLQPGPDDSRQLYLYRQFPWLSKARIQQAKPTQ
jgi:hypothetical protein